MSTASARRNRIEAGAPATSAEGQQCRQLLERLQRAVTPRREAQVLAEIVSRRAGVACVVLIGRDGGWLVEGVGGAPALAGLTFGGPVEAELKRATGKRWTIKEVRHGRRCVARLATQAPAPAVVEWAATLAAPFLAAVSLRTATERPAVTTERRRRLEMLLPRAATLTPTRRIEPKRSARVPSGSGERLDTPVEVGTLLEELAKGLDLGERLRLRVLARPIVAGDRQALQRAIGDMLAEAVQNGAPGGVVRVAVGEVGSRVFIEVAYDAAAETSDQGEPASAEADGLGLTIARAVVEAHGGGLRLVDDCGCMLLMNLPLACAA